MYKISRIPLKKFKKCSIRAVKLSTASNETFRQDLERKADKARKEFNYKNISELQVRSCERYKDKKLFGVKDGPKFNWISFGEFGLLVQRFRNVLVHHKIGKNDKVGVISNNRVEWAVAMYAVASLGGQLVPM